MVELSLWALLNSMAPPFCKYKTLGYDTTKATLLAFSDMHDKYSSRQIKNAIKNSQALKTMAVAKVATTCPMDAISK